MTIAPVNNILRSISKARSGSDTKLNILTACRNNEKYIALLSQTKHNFYILKEHKWNHLIETCPSNVQTLNEWSEPLDYIVCYDRAEQYDEMSSISQRLHVPIILVDMCSKTMIRPQHLVEQMHNINLDRLNRTANLQVYSNEHIQQSWATYNGASVIIPIGINSDKFKNEESAETCIAIDNNTIAQVGAQIATQVQDLFPILPTDHDNLQNITTNQSRYFINTNKSITIKTLEAMSAENVVICLKTPDTSNFITNRETGVLIDTIDDLRNTLVWLEKDSDTRLKIAQQARQKIVSDHSMQQFIDKWSHAFNSIKSSFYNPVSL